ncbi:MAG: molecular chaperone TorD family protein [Magnetococcales bacterium]|nr:molecular chaperone TorD family protein [Magnetococcales bacterium]
MTITLEHELTLLAGLLGQPEPGSLAAVEEMAIELPGLQAVCPELRGISLESWQAEHTRLFVNGFPTTPCPPFESFWRHGVLGGDCVQAIAGLYQRAGVAADPDISPDFLGSMLDLAAHLAAQRVAQADLRWELWEEHLAIWVPRFATRLKESAGLALYGFLGSRLLDLFGGDHARHPAKPL